MTLNIALCLEIAEKEETGADHKNVKSHTTLEVLKVLKIIANGGNREKDND